MADEERNEVPESRRSALLVIPEGAGRDEVAAALKAEDFSVRQARDTYDAFLQFVREPVKLLVLSLDGAGEQGESFIRELRRLSPDLKILLLVPEGRRCEIARFLAEGGDGLLSTPCYAAEVRFLARAMLRDSASDPLTSLPNRAAFRRAFDREYERAKRGELTLGLGLFDVDNFGQVNSDYGYLAADLVLKEVAHRLHEAFRITDPVARWGGEEFVVLLTSLPNELKAARKLAFTVLDRARAGIADEPFSLIPRRADSITVTISAGLALFPNEAETYEELFDLANKRLKLGKAGGKNRIIAGDS
jgi:diguanylate cyclase (GGDEF)-like protein